MDASVGIPSRTFKLIRLLVFNCSEIDAGSNFRNCFQTADFFKVLAALITSYSSIPATAKKLPFLIKVIPFFLNAPQLRHQYDRV